MVERGWSELAKKLKAAFPKMFTDRSELMAWYDALKGYSEEEVSEAINKWCLSNKWAPKISEICQLIPSMTEYDWTMICEIYRDCGEMPGLPSKEEYLERFDEAGRRELLERVNRKSG